VVLIKKTFQLLLINPQRACQEDASSLFVCLSFCHSVVLAEWQNDRTTTECSHPW